MNKSYGSSFSPFWLHSAFGLTPLLKFTEIMILHLLCISITIVSRLWLRIRIRSNFSFGRLDPSPYRWLESPLASWHGWLGHTSKTRRNMIPTTPQDQPFWWVYKSVKTNSGWCSSSSRLLANRAFVKLLIRGLNLTFVPSIFVLIQSRRNFTPILIAPLLIDGGPD